MNIFIDIETIPDQTKNAVELIAEHLTVKAPDLTKPKLIDALGLDQKKDKFKTVAELKDLWLLENEHSAKADQAKQQWLKSSFDGGSGQICCICVAIEDAYTEKFIGTELEILESLNRYILSFAKASQTLKPYFIGHNSIKFDLPFLHKRFVINQVKPSFDLIAHGRHGVNCFDTMIEWAGFGNRISMDNLAKALGVKGKTEGMDGSQVWPEFEKGNIDKIADYCVDDVECTREIYNRLTFK
jgi:hypothetical protein